MTKNGQWRQIIFGGILPLVLFSVVEEYYGPIWGTIVAIIFGIGEMAFEYHRDKKISPLTLGSNAFIIALGLITIFTNDGIWFKLQPAILELAIAIVLIVSVIRKKDLLSAMMKAQGQSIPENLIHFLPSLTFRLSLFFIFHSGLATWAAFYWSTEAWIALKGIGLTVSMVVYLFLEFYFLRLRTLTHLKRLDNENQK
jgi:intracellular septation protein